ncbi:hypothetical protein GCM10023189_37930 [Nibrella saemangeumensis]|uniref:Schlafen group 3-like DNA/RNA helicase domain-containing protein n=1 Tax=Nibrella saemangeumensis TaxID=1084526 RepID=A0ABP8N8T7_9BACT
MILSVNDFVDSVQEDMNGLIDHLVEVSGRSTPAEREAWQRSLPSLSIVLNQAQKQNPGISKAHLYLGHISLEYRLPAASAWCDVVLLGKNKENKSSVLIIELKDWDTTTDEAGLSEGLITHKGQQWHHPSDQVKGYTLYCQRFHSTVQTYEAQVKGCVYFTRTDYTAPYYEEPNQQLATEYPVFATTTAGTGSKLADYILDHISESDHDFAVNFEKGYYEQNRNILHQVAGSLKKTLAETRTPFELLDEQRRGFNLIFGMLKQVYEQKKEAKQVIIVEGPPGSGKSALAANLWIESVLHFVEPDKTIKAKKKLKPGSTTDNIVFVSTSSSQKSNWQKTFSKLSKEYSAKAFILPSNQFNPGLSGDKVSKLRDLGHAMEVQTWPENLKIYFDNKYPDRSPDNLHFLAIVDEAHALINTEGHSIGFASGWCVQAGPQAYHIIRSSQISIFFTDGKQSYRDNETTTIDNIKDFAYRLGATVNHISLDGHQFRCGGSREYVQFIEDLFAGKPARQLDTSWCKSDENPSGAFHVEVVDHPHELDLCLRPYLEEGLSCRLISSYSKEWKTKAMSNPHEAEETQKDFYFSYDYQGQRITFAKPWNYAPSDDYSLFIQAPEGSDMHEDPLCEIGCPYVVRGFDYDYLGLLWLEDLVWRNGKWLVQIEHVKETAISSTLAAAKEGLKKRKKAKQVELSQGELQLLDKVIKGYRILLTRALKGIYLYIHDNETRDYIKSILSEP